MLPKDTEAKTEVAHIGPRDGDRSTKMVIYVREGMTQKTVEKIEKLVDEGCDFDPEFGGKEDES